jgi:hypothetical protein
LIGGLILAETHFDRVIVMSVGALFCAGLAATLPAIASDRARRASCDGS